MKTITSEIRKGIKRICPTLSVTQHGLYLHIDGSLEFGAYTEAEIEAVYQLGLTNYRGQCKHAVNASPAEQNLLIAKLGME